MEQLDKFVLVALDRMAQTFKVLLLEQGKEKKLSPIQIQFLVYIDALPEGKSSVGEIAREFTLTAPTVSGAVKALESKGLIEREESAADRRRSYLRLTKAGQSACKSLTSWDEAILQRIQEFPLHTKETVLTFLLELLESLKNDDKFPKVKTCLSCGHFQKNIENNNGENYHICLLRDVRLENSELRLNCPNYKINVENYS